MPERRARGTGLRSQPRLSLMIGEGNKPDLNLIKLAFLSSSFVDLVCWIVPRIKLTEEEELEEGCCSLRESQVMKSKIESKNGKACGFFKKCFSDDNLDKF